jgi:hypothetical protein
MNPALFRKLVEMKLIATGTEVEVQYETYKDNGKAVKNKGLFNITRMYSHPFAFNTVVVLKNTEGLEIEADFLGIKKVAGVDPVKLAASVGVRPDGRSDDAPKRRGRKPKVRPEADEIDNDDEDEFDDEDEMAVA